MGLAHAELLGPTLTQKDLWPFTSDFTQGEERLILWCFGTGMVLECFGSLKGDVWQILIVFYRLPGWYPWCGIYTLRCHFIALADSTQVTQVTVLQDRNSAVSQPSHTQPSTQHLENLEASTQKNTKKTLGISMKFYEYLLSKSMSSHEISHCRRIFSKLWTHVIKAASLEALGSWRLICVVFCTNNFKKIGQDMGSIGIT